MMLAPVDYENLSPTALDHLTRMFDDMGVTGSVVCRGCGCLVFVTTEMMVKHADRETHGMWAAALPNWAREGTG